MKTEQLTKACEKHYELEQELAFYKIDHKFDSLGKYPTHDYKESVKVIFLKLANNVYQHDFTNNFKTMFIFSYILQPHGAGDGLIGESPYIGKGRFKHQHPPSQPTGLTHMDIDRDMMEKMHDALDRELAEKQSAIDKGEYLNYDYTIIIQHES